MPARSRSRSRERGFDLDAPRTKRHRQLESIIFDPQSIADHLWRDILPMYISAREMLLLRGVCRYFRTMYGNMFDQYLMMKDDAALIVAKHAETVPNVGLLVDVLVMQESVECGCFPVFELCIGKLTPLFASAFEFGRTFLYSTCDTVNHTGPADELHIRDNMFGLALNSQYIEILRWLLFAAGFYGVAYNPKQTLFRAIISQTNPYVTNRIILAHVPRILRVLVGSEAFIRSRLLETLEWLVLFGRHQLIDAFINAIRDLKPTYARDMSFQGNNTDDILKALKTIDPVNDASSIFRQLRPLFFPHIRHFDQWDYECLFQTNMPLILAVLTEYSVLSTESARILIIDSIASNIKNSGDRWEIFRRVSAMKVELQQCPDGSYTYPM